MALQQLFELLRPAMQKLETAHALPRWTQQALAGFADCSARGPCRDVRPPPGLQGAEYQRWSAHKQCTLLIACASGTVACGDPARFERLSQSNYVRVAAACLRKLRYAALDVGPAVSSDAIDAIDATEESEP